MSLPRSILLTLWLASSLAQAAPPTLSSIPPMPLPVDEANAARTRWMQKPVSAARPLDDLEQTNGWSHRGPGTLSFTTDRARNGRQSLRLTSPTKTEKPNPVVGRPFGEAVARREFARDDWRDFNRLSFWVYPTLPGFHHVSLLVKLLNEGNERASYTDGALNHVLLRNQEWNHVVWEIPHLKRDKVLAVDFIYRLQGNEPGATNVVCYDLDQLELQQVNADYYEGWAVAPGRIALSDSYSSDATKTALASGIDATTFELQDPRSGRRLLSKPIKRVTTPLGTFQVLDFSEATHAGPCVLKAGKVTTPPFRIDEFVWRDTVISTINLFYSLRCGYALPGIHDVCHQDWYATHGDERKIINGGWHDAGDLSQGLVNTGEAVLSMFELADRLREPDPALSQRLLEEARWGLDWMLKTRFRDGYRVTWATMDFWTDGVAGNADDVRGDVRASAYDDFVGAAAEAVAGRVLKTSDAALAQRALQAAEEDWQVAVAQLREPGLELASQGLVASVELFKATRKPVYADRAFAFADLVFRSQQRAIPDWDTPLTGFFYTAPNQRSLLHFNHRGHEQAPIYGLAELCRAFPEHPDWMKWYSVVALHSEYLRAASRFNEPYGMLAASIYAVEETKDLFDRQQILNGVRLSDRFYLRRFPVWSDFRGNHGTVLTQTKALSTAAQLRRDPSLRDLCERQLQWVLGRNPFAQSTMYGEGHDYAPQYTPLCGDITGSLPVGIQTRSAEDVPYWPASNCYNYAEVWVHPSSRWLWIQCDLAERLHRVESPPLIRSVTSRTRPEGTVEIQARLQGAGKHAVELRVSNLSGDTATRPVDLKRGGSTTVTWRGRISSPREPWIAVVLPDQDLKNLRETSGNWPAESRKAK